MNDFVQLPGKGSTPRPRDNPLISVPKGAPSIKSSEKFKELVKKFQATGKLDREDFNSGAEMGAFLDFYNDTILRSRQNEYERNVNEMNKYYRKLWIQTIDETR